MPTAARSASVRRRRGPRGGGTEQTSDQDALGVQGLAGRFGRITGGSQCGEALGQQDMGLAHAEAARRGFAVAFRTARTLEKAGQWSVPASLSRAFSAAKNAVVPEAA